MTTSRERAHRIHHLADRLERTDLRPGPDVDAAFTELVGLTLDLRAPHSAEVLGLLGPRVDRIRRLCAAGESELETHWADRVAGAARPAEELAGFPYLANYRDLVALEVGVLAGLGVRPRTAVVLGSGPLPLTGVLLAADHDVAVTLVDRDPECLLRGDGVVAALGTPGVGSVLADVADRLPAEVGTADVVLLAALVGEDDRAKRAVLDRLVGRMRPGAHLLVRSAAGLRELLYPPARLAGVSGLSMLVEVHPHHDVVNSVLVARVDGGAR